MDLHSSKQRGVTWVAGGVFCGEGSRAMACDGVSPTRAGKPGRSRQMRCSVAWPRRRPGGEKKRNEDDKDDSNGATQTDARLVRVWSVCVAKRTHVRPTSAPFRPLPPTGRRIESARPGFLIILIIFGHDRFHAPKTLQVAAIGHVPRCAQNITNFGHRPCFSGHVGHSSTQICRRDRE